jgi:hypothetical protein
MTEPLTAATDVVIAAAAATFAVRIVRATADRSARLLAGSLAATSIAALAGAAFHMARSSAMWKVSAIPVGVASCLFGLAIGWAYFSARGRRVVQIVLLVQLLVYAISVALSDDFVVVIADYASVMLAILAVCLFHWADPAARWIAAGVAISFVAAGAQISSIRIGPLNHNDIYHVIELGGLYCWYRGGLEITAFTSRRLEAPEDAPPSR